MSSRREEYSISAKSIFSKNQIILTAYQPQKKNKIMENFIRKTGSKCYQHLKPMIITHLMNYYLLNNRNYIINFLSSQSLLITPQILINRSVENRAVALMIENHKRDSPICLSTSYKIPQLPVPKILLHLFHTFHLLLF